MKLKMMHMQFTLNNLFFNIFFCDFIQLNYKPSNFALAILPYAAGQRVKMCIHKFILKNQWKNQFLAMQVHVIREWGGGGSIKQSAGVDQLETYVLIGVILLFGLFGTPPAPTHTQITPKGALSINIAKEIDEKSLKLSRGLNSTHIPNIFTLGVPPSFRGRFSQYKYVQYVYKPGPVCCQSVGFSAN